MMVARSHAVLSSTRAGGRLAAADAAAAAWEAVGQPYQTAIALTYAARIALAEQAGQAGGGRLRRAAASVHVSSILAKLGATSRTEAAVKAHQLLLLR